MRGKKSDTETLRPVVPPKEVKIKMEALADLCLMRYKGTDNTMRYKKGETFELDAEDGAYADHMEKHGQARRVK